MDRWLTPDSEPQNLTPRTIHLPQDTQYESAFYGALLVLADPENWQQYGEQTAEKTAEFFFELFKELLLWE